MPSIAKTKTNPSIILTERDLQIMERIHAYDGMMNRKQLDQLFFSGRGRSQVRSRLGALCRAGYLKSFNHLTLHDVPFGEVIYLLDTRGAQEVAALNSQPFKGFHWRPKPRLSQIRHDLKVNDFRLFVHQAAEAHPNIDLEQWIPEGEFLAHPDKIIYQDAKGKERTRLMRPDGFFTLCLKGKPSPFAFLPEIDMGTEDNPRFAREKVLPGCAYLKSNAYLERFGLRYGRWLVITTGQRRLFNMKAQTERAGGNGLFYFTTFAALKPDTILRQPVWWLAGKKTPECILPQM